MEPASIYYIFTFSLYFKSTAVSTLTLCYAALQFLSEPSFEERHFAWTSRTFCWSVCLRLIIIVEVFHLFVCSLYVRSHVHICMMAWVVNTDGGQPFIDSVPPSLICYLLKSVSSWTWSLPIWLDWMATELQVSGCLCLPSNESINTYHQSCIFTRVTEG